MKGFAKLRHLYFFAEQFVCLNVDWRYPFFYIDVKLKDDAEAYHVGPYSSHEEALRDADALLAQVVEAKAEAKQ